MKSKSVLITLIIVCSTLLSSCYVGRSYYQNVFTLDYSRYSANGIFLTEANSVSFDYQPVGSISAVVLSGYNKTKTTKTNKEQDGIYGDRTYETTKVSNDGYVKATPEQALDAAVAALADMGANGIINITISTTVQDGQSGYELRGMAIRK